MTFTQKYLLAFRKSAFESALIRTVFAVQVALFVLLAPNYGAKAATIVVPAGGDLQSAIDASQPGDTIVLQAAATYTGLFILPNKTGASYVTIQSSRASELPDGVRVSPAQSALFARMTSHGFGDPVMKTVAAAHHYKFIGIEFAPLDASAAIYNLVALGSPYSDQNTLASVPHDFVFDRCYLHGYPGQAIQRGIALNSAETSVINSWISDIHWDIDTQALCGWNGPGPFHIINNHLEASGENVMFGGATVQIPNMIPSDVEIRGNHFFKPLSWKVGDSSYAGYHWSVKNLFELKNAQRVIVDGNLFENCWGDAQVGFAFQLTPRQDPYAVVQNVTISNNIFRNTAGGINFLGVDNYTPGGPQQNHISVINNLFDNVGLEPLFQANGLDNLVIDHNTAINQYNILTLYGAPTTNAVFTNNIVANNQYGFSTDGGVPISTFLPNALIRANMILGPYYPDYYTQSGNFVTPYPGNWADVGFVDFANGNYRLAASSAYKGKATDGKDIGCDVDAILAAQSGTPGPSPTPTPTPNPSPTPTPTPTLTPTPTPTPTPIPTPTPSPTPTNQIVVVRDSFTATDGMELSQHLGELGAAWAQPWYSRNSKNYIFGNRVTHEAAFYRNLYYASGQPQANCYVQATVTMLGSASGSPAVGLILRLDPSSENYYYVGYDTNTSHWAINSNVDGTITQLGAWAETLSTGDARTVRFEVVSSSLTLFTNGVSRITVTSMDHPSAGGTGILMSGSASPSTGFAISNLEAGSLTTPTPSANPISQQIDDAQFFVRQHYLDFLNREPDAGGFAYWTDRITQCGTDARCIHERRLSVSAAFFIELEFQETGYYVYRFYRASFGRQPNYTEFTSDRSRVIGGSSLEANKQAFADEWVQRAAFTQAYSNTMSNTEVVNKLFDSAGLTASIYDPQRQQEIQAMNAGRSRALVLRDVIEIPDFKNIPDPNGPRYSELKQISQYNAALVLMQYFGYLRRNLDQGGYDFWVDIVNNQQPNNYHGMVCAFITSTEYQLRFGSVVTRSNADCGQ